MCRACVTDPGKPASTSPNEHDDELERTEEEIRSVARLCYRVGKELLEGTERDASVGAKVIGEGTKALRLACDLRDRRADREHARVLIAHEQLIAGLRKGN